MIARKIAPAVALVCVAMGAAFAATPERPDPRDAGDQRQDAVWRVAGGDLQLRFNHDLLDLHGIQVLGAEPFSGQNAEDREFALFRIGGDDALLLNAPEGGFDQFVGGLLRIQGRFDLQLPDGKALSFDQMQLRASRINGAELELVGADGRPWLYVNHLMYKMIDDYAGFYVRSADVRAAPALAERAASPELAGAYIGELKMTLHVTARPAGFLPPTLEATLACPDFHGTTHPSGGTFEADVLMEAYSMSFSRCRRGDTGANGCDGVGPDDGEVVFTPSSTLRNSNKANTADVPWYRKFTVSPHNYPYAGNDQHPYLIWNMYRITDGQLEQISASGVKHAFLTINTGCAPGACTGGGHILGKNCGDTYGTGNNDSNGDLGPRNELIPATGEWGRCGSIFDPDCDGTQNASGNTNYHQRLVVRESQMQVADSQFFSESWYIVQDDVNIYNTMAHRTMSPASGGTGWSPGSQGAFALGPLINTWVNPDTYPARNLEIATDEGHARIAVKTKQLDACPAGSGLVGVCHRYDYAVNNFDFARAKTSGTPPNLRVLSNLGFGAFQLDVGGAAVFVDPAGHFADIDIDAGNNWSVDVADGVITWSAPAGNELNWGTLYRFSVISSIAPDDAVTSEAGVVIAGSATAETLAVTIMAPFEPLPDNETIFADGFEADRTQN